MADGATQTPRLLLLHEGLTTALALGLAAYCLLRFPVVSWQTALFLGALCVLADFFAIQLPNMGSVSLSLSMFLAAVLLGGPSTAALVATIGSVSIVDIQNRRPASAMVFNAAQYVVAATVAALVVDSLGVQPLLVAQSTAVSGFGWLVVAVIATAVIVTLNALLVGVAVSINTSTPIVGVWKEFFGWYSVNMIALALLGLVLAELLYVAGIPGTLLIVVPFTIARDNFALYRRQSSAYRETVRSLVTAIEAKDPYTRGHSERVAWYAANISQSMGLSPIERQRIEWAALLHDVGKVALDANTLTKSSKLSENEYAAVRRHPAQAVEILGDIQFLEDATPLIGSHHERLDGKGYPAGLRGEEIPLGARILSVADSFDAMTSDRPYREALRYDQACAELLHGSGTQFDSECVTEFLSCVSEADLIRLLHSSEKLEGWIA